jgi:hypothetical protein
MGIGLRATAAAIGSSSPIVWVVTAAVCQPPIRVGGCPESRPHGVAPTCGTTPSGTATYFFFFLPFFFLSFFLDFLSFFLPLFLAIAASLLEGRIPVACSRAQSHPWLNRTLTGDQSRMSHRDAGPNR